MSPEPALSFDAVTVQAGGQTYITDVSLSVQPGEFHGLLGPNGAGKTTLLRTLYFANTPKSGTISLLGRAQGQWGRSDWSRAMGVLVQGGGLLAGLTVADIIEIGLRPLSLESAQFAARRDRALARVGLAEIPDQLAETLSGGELQRCYMAQLLARDPHVYVLDEPTNHLDLHYQYALLDEIKARGKSVLATLHDLTMAARYCDRVSLMARGRIVATGTPQDVLTPARLAEIYKIDARLEDGRLIVAGPLPAD